MKPIINNILRAFSLQENEEYSIFFELEESWNNPQLIAKLGENEYYLCSFYNDTLSQIEPINQAYIAPLNRKFAPEESISLSIVLVNTQIGSNSIINDDWIKINNSLLSEWSDIITITALDHAILKVEGLDPSKTTTISSSSFTVNGSFEGDNLFWYRVFLKHETEGRVETSDKIYLTPDDKNKFSLPLDHLFSELSGKYELSVLYSTQKGYMELVSYPLKVEEVGIDTNIILNPTIEPVSDQGIVQIDININNKDNAQKAGEIVILRSSVKTEWKIKEQIGILTCTLNPGVSHYRFTDGIAESGIAYKYTIYFQGADNSSEKYQSDIIFLLFDDIILSTDTQQLKIKYNPDINNYKNIIGDTITQTLGARYPIFRRNGQMKYKQFNIGGLISYNAEETDSSLLSDINLSLYADLSQIDREFIYEKLYREKVLEFLYGNKPILFRSLPEGNMIVRLTNISFTPEKKLGRLIYSFSAQATEVAEPTLSNYKKYNLYNAKFLVDTDKGETRYYNDYYVLADIDSDSDDAITVADTEIYEGDLIVHKDSYEF